MSSPLHYLVADGLGQEEEEHVGEGGKADDNRNAVGGEESSDDEIDVDSAGMPSREDVQQEALRLLEWEAICNQVAPFAATPMGCSVAQNANLVLGGSQEKSEELLAQTAAALALQKPLSLGDVVDVTPVVATARAGQMCGVQSLCDVASTLRVAREVYQMLQPLDSMPGTQDKAELGPLRAIMEGADFCGSLEADIWHCLDPVLGVVRDAASAELAEVRAQRRANMRELEALLAAAGRHAVAIGGADNVIVTRRNSRLCVAVRASHKALLTAGGGVSLGSSNTGATYFVEPANAVPGNNTEKELEGAEEALAAAVTAALSRQLETAAAAVLDVVSRLTTLDLACARAGHARWLRSVRPTFSGNGGRVPHHAGVQTEVAISSPQGVQENVNDETVTGNPSSQAALGMDIPQIRHPLLLAAALSPPLGKLKAGPDPFRKGSGSTRAEGTIQDGRGESSLAEDVKLPVPIDIKIAPHIRVVAITGPNTGGKTAALKTIGVASLMARAGMFLPAQGSPRIPWFDCVLADIGDEQSLEQNLSTFSGHIRRLIRMLQAAGPSSLVLLDEVGSGTDPLEGASLAAAVLRHLSKSCGLAIATTHYAELKSLKARDPVFENASVAFDLETLRPAYHVLWGQSGQSNALAIAAARGLDSRVLARACQLAAQLTPADAGARASDLIGPLLKQQQAQEERAAAAESALRDVQALHAKLEQEVQELELREARLRQHQQLSVQRQVANARARMAEEVHQLERRLAGVTAPGAADMAIPEMDGEVNPAAEATAAILAIANEYGPSGPTTLEVTSGSQWSPRVGERVLVQRLGRSPVTVMAEPEPGSNELAVQLGMMRLFVKVSEVLPFQSTIGQEGSPLRRQIRRGQMLSKDFLMTAGKGMAPGEGADSPPLKFDPAIQTSRNTVDVRGLRAEEALRELDLALAVRSPGAVLFLIHGVGTGRLQEAALKFLKQHPNVAKTEPDGMNAGCTVVYIK